MVRRKDGRMQEQVTVTVNGRPKQKYFYGKSKAEVLRKIAEWKQQEEERRIKGHPFSDVADEWWEHTEGTIAVRTQKGYRPALKRAKEYFGATPIQTITPAEISVFLRSAVKKNDMAEKTAKTQLSICNLIFRYAVQAGYILSNPARDLDVPGGLKRQAREDASPEDIAAIQKLADTPMGMMANWFLYTGLRRSELLALTWEDVDMDNRVINVRRSLVRIGSKDTTKEPKTEAGCRKVPILNDLAEKLKPGKGLVFPHENGGFISDGSFTKRWTNFQKDTGITCTPHQLRHSATTMFCEAISDGRLTVEDVQHIIGHAQYQTTMNIYNHYKEESRKKAWSHILDIAPTCQNPVSAPAPIENS